MGRLILAIAIVLHLFAYAFVLYKQLYSLAFILFAGDFLLIIGVYHSKSGKDVVSAFKKLSLPLSKEKIAWSILFCFSVFWFHPPEEIKLSLNITSQIFVDSAIVLMLLFLAMIFYKHKLEKQR